MLAMSAAIITPAVVGALDAPVAHLAQGQGDIPVGAAVQQGMGRAGFIPEEHERCLEDGARHRPIPEITGLRSDVP